MLLSECLVPNEGLARTMTVGILLEIFADNSYVIATNHETHSLYKVIIHTYVCMYIFLVRTWIILCTCHYLLHGVLLVLCG